MRFYLIGHLRLEGESDDQQAPVPPRLRKTQGLLAYLLLFRNRSHSRERLASLFWGDVPEERSLPNLSLALNQIRPLLTGSSVALQTDRFTVRLDLGSAWLDVAALECGLADGGDRANRTEVLRLYTADLLEGWNDEWCIIERERLRHLVLQTGTALVREYLAEGTWAEGVSLAQLLLSHDLLNDTLQDLYLRLLLGSGDYAEARKQYQRFAALLRSEMDLDPASSTKQLYTLAVQAAHSASAVRHDRPQPTLGHSSIGSAGLLLRLPFVGRITQRQTLREAIAAVRKGEGGLLLVRGEAGAGKTRLVEEALSETPGLRVARGRAFESGHDVPYGPLLEPLSQWLVGELAPAQVQSRLGTVATTAIAQLLPALSAKLPQLRPLAQLPPEEAQVRLMQSVVTALLSSVTPQSPGVLFLDDLQWADTPTLQVLEQLLTQLHRAPLLVIGSFRSEEASDSGILSALAVRLQRGNKSAVLDVTLLSLAEVHELIEPRMPRPALSEWLFERSGGNAFYLAELLRGLTESGTVVIDPTVGGWRLSEVAHLPQADEASLFPGVQEMVMSRFGRLSEAGQLVGRVLSVVGDEVDFELLMEASRLSEEDALTGLEEGLSRRFFSQSSRSSSYLVAHDLIRQAIYNAMSAPRRSRLHEQVGRALESITDGPLETSLLLKLAYHYSRSANKAKQREYLLQAAEAAQAAYMNGTAIDYYNRLLPLLPSSEQTRVILKLGEVQQLTGQIVVAEANFQRAVERAERAGDTNNVALGKAFLADLLRTKGQYEEAIELAEQAREIFAQLEDRNGLLQVLNTLAAACWALVRYSEAQVYVDQQVRLATELGDRKAISKALRVRGNIHSEHGDYDQAIASLEAALKTTLESDDKHGVMYAHWSIGYAYLQQKDYRRALHHFAQTANLAVEIGSRYVLRVALSGMGDAYERYGEHKEGLACYMTYLDMSLQANNQLGVMIAVDNIASIYAAQGLLDRAEQNMLRAIILARRHKPYYYLGQYLCRIAELYWILGRYGEAQTLNKEASQIFTEVEYPEYKLRATLLGIQLQVALAELSIDDAIAGCKELLPQCSQATEEAMVHYTIWALNPNLEEARSRAASLYKSLYEQLPGTEYRQRYEELTGVALPKPAPLPEPPKTVLNNRSDLEQLLTSVDRLIAELPPITDDKR